MMNTTKLLIFAVIFGIGQRSFAQEKVNLTAGFGLPELLNVGALYQLKQTQVGAYIGSIPLNNENIIAFGGDVYYHFAGHSELSERRPWYGKTGLNYLREETNAKISKDLYLNLRFGRDLNISRKFGVAIDAGTSIQLYHKEIQKEPSNNWFDLDINYPVIPTFQARIYYRL